MYDCSGKEGVFIVVLECGYLSVCQSVDVSALPTVWCEIIGGRDCDNVTSDLVQHDKATVDATLIHVSLIALYGNKEEQPHRGNVWVSIIILAWSLNLKQTLENANNQVGKHNSLKS